MIKVAKGNEDFHFHHVALGQLPSAQVEDRVWGAKKMVKIF
jgi:hypothetical protein